VQNRCVVGNLLDVTETQDNAKAGYSSGAGLKLLTSRN
jgi:hypothetical protein